MKLSKFLSPLYLAGLLSSLLTIFTIFLFTKKKKNSASPFRILKWLQRAGMLPESG